MTEPFDNQALPESTNQHRITSSEQELLNDGWTPKQHNACKKCGESLRQFESPSGGKLLLNTDGSLHIFCGERDPMPPPLPEPPDQEEFVRKMREEK